MGIIVSVRESLNYFSNINSDSRFNYCFSRPYFEQSSFFVLSQGMCTSHIMNICWIAAHYIISRNVRLSLLEYLNHLKNGITKYCNLCANNHPEYFVTCRNIFAENNEKQNDHLAYNDII
ncbi:hypothetical protein HZS_2636 [Henneguya salminicola]|nr:hypothetical protein HZS_2636 [Henneguya salminicola]